jgi:hypothetical protein
MATMAQAVSLIRIRHQLTIRTAWYLPAQLLVLPEVVVPQTQFVEFNQKK